MAAERVGVLPSTNGPVVCCLVQPYFFFVVQATVSRFGESSLARGIIGCPVQFGCGQQAVVTE